MTRKDRLSQLMLSLDVLKMAAEFDAMGAKQIHMYPLSNESKKYIAMMCHRLQ
jgi:hypothetical protein